MTGCACVDPLEPINRKIFAFNMVIDQVVFRPVATAYDKVMPTFLVCRVENFFNNVDDVTNIANNVLQCKFLDAWSDCWRLAFNTTFGLFGLFDVATRAGLEKHHQDFGLTLARYGFVQSTYLMVPFFGPSTLRDSIGWTVDWRYLSVWPYIQPRSLRYGLYGFRLVHKRASLLAADKLIEEAIDPYLFVRDAYLQKRECDIKSICPSGDIENKSPTKSTEEDTFVSESQTPLDEKKSYNADDPFIADENEPSKKNNMKPNAKTSTTDGDDPFVTP